MAIIQTKFLAPNSISESYPFDLVYGLANESHRYLLNCDEENYKNILSFLDHSEKDVCHTIFLSL